MSVDFEKRIGQFVQLRDKIKEMEDRHKAELKPYKEALETLNGMLLGFLLTTGQDNAAVKGVGTAYKKVKKSATIADAAAFRRHVIGGQLWDLIDFRANVTEVSRVIDETGEPPPGINYSTLVDVGVRRGSASNNSSGE